MDKAESEYKKYQAKTLSSVEKDYFEAIKVIEKKIATTRKIRVVRSEEKATGKTSKSKK